MKNSKSFVSNELRIPRLPLTTGEPGEDGKTSRADGLYRFGQFALDSRKRTLFRADSPVSLTAKAFDVLLYLAQNPKRLVTKEELLQAVWGDTFVEEGNLTQYISHLRKALGDAPEDRRLIVTIARKGYQFTADVTVAEAADTAKQTAVQVSTVEMSLGDTQSGLERSGDGAVPRAPRHWQRAAVVAASAVLLGVVSVASWRHFGGMTPRSQKIMLAVLPFENLTGDPDKEYLADGLTEETISQLGRLNPERLGVIARTSVMGYKHKDERLDQIGRDLSVEYVLENSLRESGGRLRLTAQLIQVKDQTHLWSQDYDYPVKDVLNIEDDVAKALSHEIRVRLTTRQQAELAHSHPANSQAFDAYLQGHYFFERNTDKDTEMAARYYERATQLDPSYALAWVGLSRVRKWQAVRGLMPTDEGYRLAREAVERALALNPNLADAHTQMGRIKQQVDFDWSGADSSSQRAIALEPENTESVRLAALSAVILGRFDEALRLGRRAVDLDPLNGSSWESLGEIKFFRGQLDDAVADLKKALELRPDRWNGHIFLSQTYVLQGRPQDALSEIDLVRNDSFRDCLYVIANHAFGRHRASDSALSKFVTNYRAGNSYLIAEAYAFRNQSDEAFDWLDRAYAEHNDGLIGTKIDPLLMNLHKDPRFAAFLKKLNLLS
jgi:TolB-like protein/DNA-binding winged helix-turn-helix (wHTH) protein